MAHDLNGATDVFVRDLTGFTTTLVSADNTNDEGEGSSRTPAISADGRFVAFQTTAALVDTDGNDVSDIYLRDRSRTRTKRLSTTFLLGDGHGPSFGTPALSGDARSVSFQSSASDLATPDTDHVDDVFTRAAIVPTIGQVHRHSTRPGRWTIARGTDVYFIIKGSYFMPDTQAYALGNGADHRRHHDPEREPAHDPREPRPPTRRSAPPASWSRCPAPAAGRTPAPRRCAPACRSPADRRPDHTGGFRSRHRGAPARRAGTRQSHSVT